MDKNVILVLKNEDLRKVDYTPIKILKRFNKISKLRAERDNELNIDPFYRSVRDAVGRFIEDHDLIRDNSISHNQNQDIDKGHKFGFIEIGEYYGDRFLVRNDTKEYSKVPYHKFTEAKPGYKWVSIAHKKDIYLGADAFDATLKASYDRYVKILRIGDASHVFTVTDNGTNLRFGEHIIFTKGTTFEEFCKENKCIASYPISQFIINGEFIDVISKGYTREEAIYNTIFNGLTNLGGMTIDEYNEKIKNIIDSINDDDILVSLTCGD